MNSSNVWIGRFRLQNWLPWQHQLRDRKTNFRSFIYSHSSSISTNWVKIRLVDVQTKGLTESLRKDRKETQLSQMLEFTRDNKMNHVRLCAPN